MLKLQVVIGSTRTGRSADHVVRWFSPLVQAHKEFEVETLDLRDWPLPFFQEGIATLGGDLSNPKYSDPLVTKWNAKIKEADAYVFVTAEYNHGIPAALKNAIDTVFFSFGFRHKPIAFVGYSTGVGAGVRAVEQLNHVMLETEAVPVRTQTLIPFVLAAFGPDGKPTNPAIEMGATVMLDDLAWLGNALKTARAAGEAPPPSLRIRAMSAKH